MAKIFHYSFLCNVERFDVTYSDECGETNDYCNIFSLLFFHSNLFFFFSLHQCCSPRGIQLLNGRIKECPSSCATGAQCQERSKVRFSTTHFPELKNISTYKRKEKSCFVWDVPIGAPFFMIVQFLGKVMYIENVTQENSSLSQQRLCQLGKFFGKPVGLI